jgi:nucleolar protein 15
VVFPCRLARIINVYSTDGRKKKKQKKVQNALPVDTEKSLDAPIARVELAVTDAPVELAEEDAAKPKKKAKWSAERKAEAKKERSGKAAVEAAPPPSDAPATVTDILPSTSGTRTKRRKVVAKVDEPLIEPVVQVSSNTSLASVKPRKETKKVSLSSKIKAPRPPSPPTAPEPSASETESFAHEQEAEYHRAEDDEALNDGSDSDLHLHGFSTDEDSSDDDMDAEEFSGFDVASLPTIARDDATVKRKLDKAKRLPVRCVRLASPVLLNHL